jgi:hypothetical protein
VFICFVARAASQRLKPGGVRKRVEGVIDIRIAGSLSMHLFEKSTFVFDVSCLKNSIFEESVYNNPFCVCSVDCTSLICNMKLYRAAINYSPRFKLK